ncbi:MAG: hypothetical protein KDI51_07930 [Xanthomonadales bacterium]|nr:hypothetical protein [Xanthomonadales bacterium]
MQRCLTNRAALSQTEYPTAQAASTMGILTFCINLTLDGCVDHEAGIADDETHAFFSR